MNDCCTCEYCMIVAHVRDAWLLHKQVMHNCCPCKYCMIAAHASAVWLLHMQVLYGCFRNPSGNSLKCCSAHIFVFTLSKVYSKSPVSGIWWMNKQRKETHEISRWNKESKVQAVCSPSSDIAQLLLEHIDFLTKASLLTTGQHPHLCAFCFPSGYSFLIPAYQHSSWKYVNAYVLTYLCTCPHFLPIPEPSPTAKVHDAFLFL